MRVHGDQLIPNPRRGGVASPTLVYFYLSLYLFAYSFISSFQVEKEGTEQRNREREERPGAESRVMKPADIKFHRTNPGTALTSVYGQRREPMRRVSNLGSARFRSVNTAGNCGPVGQKQKEGKHFRIGERRTLGAAGKFGGEDCSR